MRWIARLLGGCRSIYESGSPDCGWSWMNESEARRRSDKFFDAVDCASTSDTDQLMTCLRQLDAFFIRDLEWVTDQFVVNPSHSCYNLHIGRSTESPDAICFN